MAKVIKTIQVVEFDDGTSTVVSTDRRQMARWYGLDYLKDKARLTDKGNLLAEVSSDFYFAPTFRKKDKQHKCI